MSTKNDEPPGHLICPLTQCMFRTPVLLETGHVYDKEAIDGWLQNHTTDPNTNEELNFPEMRIPAVSQRQQVQRWLEEHPDVSAEDLGWETRDLPSAQTVRVLPSAQAPVVDGDNLQDMESALKCPLTREYCRDPVILVDCSNQDTTDSRGGHTYERQAIVNHIQSSRGPYVTDPASNVNISRPKLVINWNIRKLMEQFLQEHPDFTPESWPNRVIPPSLLNRDIFDCIKKADYDTLRMILSETGGVNNRDRRGHTAIAQAIFNTFDPRYMIYHAVLKDIFHFLIANGADVHVRFSGSSLVKLVIESQTQNREDLRETQTDMLRVLLQSGAPIDIDDGHYFHPLKQTVQDKNFHLSDLLIPKISDAKELGLALVASIPVGFEECGKTILAKLLSQPWIQSGDETKYFFTALKKCITKMLPTNTEYMLKQYEDYSKAEQVSGVKGIGFDLDECLGQAVYELSGIDLDELCVGPESRKNYELRQKKILRVIFKHIHGKHCVPDEFIMNQTHRFMINGNRARTLEHGTPYLHWCGLLKQPIDFNEHSSLYRSIKTGQMYLANKLLDEVQGFVDIGHCIIALMIRGDYERNEILFDNLLKQFNWDDQLKHKDEPKPTNYELDTILTKALKCKVEEEYIHALIDAAIKADKKEYLQVPDGKDQEPLALCGIPSIAKRLIDTRRDPIPVSTMSSAVKRQPFGIFLLHEMLKKNDLEFGSTLLSELLHEAFTADIPNPKPDPANPYVAHGNPAIAQYLFEKEATLTITQVANILKKWWSIYCNCERGDRDPQHPHDEWDQVIEFQKQFTLYANVLESAFEIGPIHEILRTRDWNIHLRNDLTWQGNIIHFICRFPQIIQDSHSLLSLILSKELGDSLLNQKCKINNQRFTPLQLACKNIGRFPHIQALLNAGAQLIPRGALTQDYPINIAFRTLQDVITRRYSVMKKIGGAELADVEGNLAGILFECSCQLENCTRQIQTLLEKGRDCADYLRLDKDAEPDQRVRGMQNSLLLRSLQSFIPLDNISRIPLGPSDSEDEKERGNAVGHVQKLYLYRHFHSGRVEILTGSEKEGVYACDDDYSIFKNAKARKLSQFLSPSSEEERVTQHDITMKIIDMYSSSQTSVTEDWVVTEGWVNEISLALISCVDLEPSIGVPIAKRIREVFGFHALDKNIHKILHETISCYNPAMFDFVMDHLHEFGQCDFHPLTDCTFRLIGLFSFLTTTPVSLNDNWAQREDCLKHMLSRILKVTAVIPPAVVHALFPVGSISANFESEITFKGIRNQIIWKDIRNQIMDHPGFNINAIGDLHLWRTRLGGNEETPLYRTLKSFPDTPLDHLEEMLVKGADVNLQCGSHKNTALHHAVLESRYNNQTLLKFLWKHSNEPNLKATDIVGNTPLHFAHDENTAKWLLERGADLEIENDFGQTPLQFCEQILEAFDSSKYAHPEACESYKKSFEDLGHKFLKPRLNRIQKTISFLKKVADGTYVVQSKSKKNQKQLKKSGEKMQNKGKRSRDTDSDEGADAVLLNPANVLAVLDAPKPQITSKGKKRKSPAIESGESSKKNKTINYEDEDEDEDYLPMPKIE